ncbi:MAG: 50S ribosomal protein L10 [Candidatus Omnitrophota bacterium]
MPKFEKELIVQELTQRFTEANYFFVTGYQGIDANRLNGLRKKLLEARTDYIVLKNTLGKMALKNRKMDLLADLIDGPTSIAYTNHDPVATSKVLIDFSKENETLKIRGAFLDGKILDADDVKLLAALPPKNIILAQLVGAIAAPLTGLVGVLSGVIRGLVTVVKKIEEETEKE